MALDYLPSPGWAVIYGETPSATRWSELGDNDDALATGAGIDDLAILTRHLAADSVTPAKLNFGIPTSVGGLSGSTASSSFVDVPGGSINLTTNAGGVVLIIWSAQMVGSDLPFSVKASGANTFSSNDEDSTYASTANFTFSQFRLITGLNAGSTTFQLQVKSNSGTSKSYIRAKMAVIPLQ